MDILPNWLRFEIWPTTSSLGVVASLSANIGQTTMSTAGQSSKHALIANIITRELRIKTLWLLRRGLGSYVPQKTSTLSKITIPITLTKLASKWA